MASGRPTGGAPAAAARRASVHGVAAVLGVGVANARVPLDDDTWWVPPGDLVLSIDAASFRGTDWCITIALLAPERRLLTIWANDRIATWETWFARIPADVRARLQGICIDMTAVYRKAIRRAGPHAQAVRDPFHRVQAGTRQLDEVRRLEQTATGQPIRRGPLLKGGEHLWPRPAEARAHQRRGMRPCRRLRVGPDGQAVAAHHSGAMGSRAGGHQRVHCGGPHENQSAETPELRTVEPRSLST